MPHPESNDVGYERRQRMEAAEISQPGAYTPPRKRPIVVTVAGERGSGRTTLISLVAHALTNSGHLVRTPSGTPNATQAIRELREQFDVTFVEDGPAWSQDAVECGEAPTDDFREETIAIAARERDAFRHAIDLRQELLELRKTHGAHLESCAKEAAQLRATIDDLRGQVAGLSARNHTLERDAANVATAPRETVTLKLDTSVIANAAREASLAIEEVRQSVVLDMERQALLKQVHDINAKAAMLRRESQGRVDKARERLMQVFTSQDRRDIGVAVAVKAGARPTAAPDFTYRPGVAGARTLFEQAAEIEASTRYGAAIEKLLAANTELMAEDFDGGC